MFFAVSFQLKSKATSIKVDVNFSSQIKDLALPNFFIKAWLQLLPLLRELGIC